MLSEPAAWQRLMSRLVTVQADYLAAQVRAGASVLQVFDSWAGRALGQSDYVRYVQPHNTRLFAAIAGTGVPVINFSLGVGSYIEEAVACGGDVIGLDWQLPLRTCVGAHRLRPPGPGEPRSDGAARSLARS